MSRETKTSDKPILYLPCKPEGLFPWTDVEREKLFPDAKELSTLKGDSSMFFCIAHKLMTFWQIWSDVLRTNERFIKIIKSMKSDQTKISQEDAQFLFYTLLNLTDQMGKLISIEDPAVEIGLLLKHSRYANCHEDENSNEIKIHEDEVVPKDPSEHSLLE